MDYFNQTIKDNLNNFLNNTSKFKMVVLWGKSGNGKTYAVNSVLQENHIKTKNVIFSEDNILPLELQEKVFSSVHDEDALLIQYSQFLQTNYCLFFQNMEFCDLDSQRVLYRLIKYHKSNDQKACIILEYNVSNEPEDILCSLSADKLFVGNPSTDCFYKYYIAHFVDTPKNKILFNKVILITNKNIKNFFTVLRILQYMGVLQIVEHRFVYNSHSIYKIPDSLFELYVDLFDGLKEYAQEPLISTAPFSKRIYSTIIQGIYHNYDRFEEYLKLLSKKGCFILEEHTDINKYSQFFQAHYVFSDEYARKAVIARTNPNKTEKIISRYYNHLDSLYNNKHIYNNLKNSDKILLLSKLTQKRQNTLKINQIPYITELMKYYYNCFMYLNVIKLGESLLEIRILNNIQLNNESHQFWVILFKSLLSVGNYEKIIGYRGMFGDNDLNFYIAVALYNYGRPKDALDILENTLYNSTEYKGYIYNLTSSIYDWLGENKKSTVAFKKALTFASDDELKYQLYKKYSMYIDFRIPECREKMNCAIEYYKSRNMKHYAECLHNYGTGCVMTRRFREAEKYLESAVDILNKICANEIYYSLNSLAILYCHDRHRYKIAINVLKRALMCDIDIAFCKLAIHNNLFNIEINEGDIDSAKNEKNILEILFKKECNDLKNISKERPDIQHQLRQFYYNSALLCKLQNNDEDALRYYLKAKECSIYHSVVLYSIEKNIADLRAKLGKKGLIARLKIKKNLTPTNLEKFIYENNLYLCELMFWG